MHIDQKYINYLQKHDSSGIDSIYSQFAIKVKRMIIANSGSEEEAADIFQESLIDIYKLSLNEGFVLTCSFEAFLIIVCKRKWLTVLKSSHKKKVTIVEDELFTNVGADDFAIAELNALKMEKEKTILTLLETLGETCRSIIKACLKERRQEVVATKLGFSYAYLRKKKSICMAEYAKIVKAHPLFNH